MNDHQQLQLGVLDLNADLRHNLHLHYGRRNEDLFDSLYLSLWHSLERHLGLALWHHALEER